MQGNISQVKCISPELISYLTYHSLFSYFTSPWVNLLFNLSQFILLFHFSRVNLLLNLSQFILLLHFSRVNLLFNLSQFILLLHFSRVNLLLNLSQFILLFHFSRVNLLLNLSQFIYLNIMSPFVGAMMSSYLPCLILSDDLHDL